MSSVQKKITQNTLIQVVGKTLSTIIGVLTLAVLTRVLEPEGYGDFTIVLTYISIFAVLVDFGLTLTTVQLISEKGANEERLLGNLVALRTVSAFFFLALAPIIALAFPYTSAIKVGIAVSALSYLLFANSQLLVGLFQKRFLIWQPTLAELLNRLTVLALVIAAGTVIDLTVVQILWMFVAGNVVHLFTTLLFARKHVSLKPAWDLNEWKRILKRSWPIGVSILFNLIYLRGDILFMSFYRSSAEIGLYGAAYKVVDVMTTIPVAYMGLALPVLVLAYSKHKPSELNTGLQSAFDYFSILAIGFVFGSIALGVPVMEFISGAEFSESGRVLWILGPAASIVFFGSLFGHAVVAVNKQRLMTLGYAFVGALAIIGYLLFIPPYGMYGAAWVTVGSETLITALTFLVVYRSTRFVPNLTVFFKSFVAGAVMFAVLQYLTLDIPVLINILVGCTVFSLSLLALRGFPKRA